MESEQFLNRRRSWGEAVSILLVEDDAQFADLVRAQLRRSPSLQSRLEVAGTLREALAKMAAEPFGLVVADLNLPDSRGLDTLGALSRAGEQPIIVLTGDPDPAMRAGAIDSGAYDFLSKDNLSAAVLERLVRLASIQANTYRLVRESEARFRSLVKLSTDFYWETDAEHRVVKIEHGSERHPAVNPMQIGKPRWDMPSTHPDAEGWAAHRATMDAHRPFRDFEIARLDEDGSERWRSISGDPVFDADGSFRGYRGVGRDITERKRAEEELRRFRLAMDESADMIVLIDRAAMRFVDVNRTACKLLGYAREELLALGPQDVLPVSREELESSYDELIADPSRPSGMNSHYRRKDGSLLPFESTRRVLRSGAGWIIAAISRDITERIAAEKALRQSEARFRSLNALSSDWYWEQDSEFRLSFMSNIDKLGLDPSQYLGRRRWEQPALNLTEGDWERHRRQLERHEPFHDFEMQRPAAGGGSVWLSLSGEPFFDEAGRFAGYRGVGRDITERKRAEEERRRLAAMYVALGAANEAILRASSPEEVFEQVCDIAVEAGGFLLGMVLLLDPRTKVLSRAAASGSAAAQAEEVAPSADESAPGGRGLIGHVCRTGERAIANDYQSDPRTEGRREFGRGYHVGSSAVFPLRVEGELTGVFGLRHAERGAFTEELTALLQRLADNVSFALENFRRDKRRRTAKRKLSESEERFRSLTGLSSDMYWEQDAEHRFTTLSASGPEWLDSVRRGRLLGQRRWDQKYFNMTEADWAAHRAVLDAHQPFRDLELGRVNEAGDKIWVTVSGEPVFDEAGRFKGYHGVGKDISARKRAEQLRELEHSVTRSLAEANSVPEALRGAIRAVCRAEGWECGRYFSADAKAGVLRFSFAWGVEDDAVQRFLAASGDATYAPGVGLAGYVWQTGEPLWVSDLHKDGRVSRTSLARDSGMHGAFVFPVIADGRTIGVLAFNSRGLRQAEESLLQAIRIIGSQVGQFVQRKQAEDVLRASEARFRALTDLSSDWYWEQDTEFRFTKFEGKGTGSPDYGPAAAVLGKAIWEVAGIERESTDWEKHRATLERHESFRNLQYSYRSGSGKRYYVSVDGQPFFDADGRFAGYRGTSRDITRQRRDEEELRRFRAAMDMSLDSIYLTDRGSMRFVDVNEAACRGVGCSRDELLKIGPEELLRVRRKVLEAEYDAVIAQGAAGTQSETSYVTGEGRRGWIELHRRALRSGEGWIIVTVSRDITERKRAEERQARHLRYQERIARFGRSALAKRRPAELVEEAVQNLLEGLGADAVAYFERGAGARELLLHALVGAGSGGPAGAIVVDPANPVLAALASGERLIVEDLQTPLAWAKGLRSSALVPVRGERGERGERGVRGVLCVGLERAEPFAAEALNFMEAAASVLSAGLQRIDSEGRLAFLAQFDPLTGLPNRALLADRFAQMIELAKRRGTTLSVLFVDLDEFKLVNDTLGHAGGDELLKEVAVRLQACVRSGDTVARISGDEFAVVLADMARPEDAALVAQKMIDRFGAAFEVHGQETFVTASIGIAAYPGDGADAEALISAADAAMYRAKQAGRNAFQFFTAEINQRSRARAQLGVELRRALEREEFRVYYQPKYQLATRQAHGAEALLRWQHPERGLVSPAEFIPVLEETGLIVAVGEWVLRRACEDLKAWRAAGLATGPVAVNLSARQFRLQDLDSRIRGIIQAAGIEPSLIELEITESQLMLDPDHAIRVMRSLGDAGIGIAIDDFGTGYSSLSYLTRFPVSSLKIDRSFVAGVNQDPNNASIVRTIIEMAHSLGFNVVAEGVENEDQAMFLRLLRCEQAQGYLFARPMPAADLARLFGAASAVRGEARP